MFHWSLSGFCEEVFRNEMGWIKVMTLDVSIFCILLEKWKLKLNIKLQTHKLFQSNSHVDVQLKEVSSTTTKQTFSEHLLCCLSKDHFLIKTAVGIRIWLWVVGGPLNFDKHRAQSSRCFRIHRYRFAFSRAPQKCFKLLSRVGTGFYVCSFFIFAVVSIF